MERTPDEIKKGLEALKFVANAGRIDDALALIQRLESDKQQLEGMFTHMNQLRDAAAGRALKMEERARQLEAERDAAVADLAKCTVSHCPYCLHWDGSKWDDPTKNEVCILCRYGCKSRFKWRGVQKEE